MGIESDYREAIAKAQVALEAEAARGVRIARLRITDYEPISSSPHIPGAAVGSYGAAVGFKNEDALNWQRRVRAVRNMTLISTKGPNLNTISGTTPDGKQIVLTSRRIMRRNVWVRGMIDHDIPLSRKMARELFRASVGPLGRRNALLQSANAPKP